MDVLNFERFKGGGGRRDGLRLVPFDFVQCQRAPRSLPRQTSRGPSACDTNTHRNATRTDPAG